MTRRTHGIILPLLFALMIAPAAYGRPIDVAEIIKKFKSVYGSTRSATVRFEQSSQAGTSRGTLTYDGGGKFRMEMPKQTMVSDGAKTWVYAPEKKQVVISKAASGSDRLTPEDILTAFPGDYRTELTGEQTVNGRAVWVVRCVPGSGKKIGDVARSTLYIDKSSYRLQQVEIESPSIGKVKIRVISAQYGTKIPASTFSFVAPKGARVVDLSR